MRHKCYRYKGVFYTRTEIAHIFRLTPPAFSARITNGWRLINNELVPPKIKLGQTQWRKDRLVTNHENRIMKSSFLGDPEIVENVYC